MISFDQALARILQHAEPLPGITLPLERARDHALAADLVAAADMPPFDNSAVDGFGVSVADLCGASAERPICLPVERTIRAGDAVVSEAVPQGRAVRIMTGAPVPRGVDGVIMQEHTSRQGDGVRFDRPAAPGDNIRRRGEEHRAGDLLVSAGTRLTPPVIGLLAGGGHCAVQVHATPRVAVVVTGSELVEPGAPRRAGQIYESNAPALAGALAAMNIGDVVCFSFRDEPREIEEGIVAALATADVLLTVGGVSVGDTDHVKDAFASAGVAEVFWRIDMKPGKPNYFGVYEGAAGRRALVFGLPGNPVSAQVSFHLLVRPALLRLGGHAQVHAQILQAAMAADFRRRPGRREFLRAVLHSEQGRCVVEPLPGQGSHMLSGLAHANALIDVPPGLETLSKGQQVCVIRLDW